jgi:hypothetical protein
VNTGGQLGRRRFLLLSSSLGLPPLLATAAPWEHLLRGGGGPSSAHSQLSNLLSHSESARAIGHAYLALAPEEASATCLLRRIHRSLADRRAGARDLRELVARRIAQDFAEDRIVELQGWILARTEARLCALKALG